jgi:hypothetical protein
MTFTDEELAAQALAADPEVAVAEDAVSVWELFGEDAEPNLPGWYMPSPMAGRRRFTGWRRRVIFAVIFAFLMIDAAGLCSTYGAIVLA